MMRDLGRLAALVLWAVFGLATLVVWPVTVGRGWRRRRRLARWAGRRPQARGWFV
jgi:hypothetical protein